VSGGGMSDVATTVVDDWHVLDGIDPAAATFPARARAGNEPLIVLALGEGKFRGVQRACPHLHAPFAEGALMSNATMLRCTKHNYIFRLSDGKGVNCPGFRIKVFEVKTEDNRLLARLVPQA
jgi:nitrite reductase/ring-hydroxylating ferredoxin subunit